MPAKLCKPGFVAVVSDEVSQSPVQPLIGVAAVVFDDAGRVLLIRRAKPPAQGLWHVPGGRLEAGEGLVDACRREVREETGVEIAVDRLIAVVERREPGFHYVILDFFGHLPEGVDRRCRPADDATDAAWVAETELADYDLAAGLLPILDRARRAWRGESLGLADDRSPMTDFIPMI